VEVEFDKGKATAREIIIQVKQHAEIAILHFVPGLVSSLKQAAVGMVQIETTRLVAQNIRHLEPG